MKSILEVIKLNKGNIDKVKINNLVDFIDFDLPSGTLWATCNIAANTLEEPGNYYQ